MTTEQIEQAAKEYRYEEHHSTGYYTIQQIEDIKEFAFIAGAEVRQREINALLADIEAYKRDITQGLERERIAASIIKEKREMVENLQGQLDSMQSMLDSETKIYQSRRKAPTKQE